MGQVNFDDMLDGDNKARRNIDNNKAGGYFLVVDDKGNMKCSCGRGLVKMEDGCWKCPGGYPIYRPSQGDILIDKFGNMMFKQIPHGSDENAGGAGNG